MIRRPPRSTLFPYTTALPILPPKWLLATLAQSSPQYGLLRLGLCPGLEHPLDHRYGTRSEEHTSELQSQSNLVCRLLLEKKNTPDRAASAREPRHSAAPAHLG